MERLKATLLSRCYHAVILGLFRGRERENLPELYFDVVLSILSRRTSEAVEQLMQVSTGLDRSKPLLARAKKLAEEANVEVTWIEQDMRDLPGGARFAAVLNLWGSFGYFDDAGNRRFLESAFESLRPDGQLVIDAPTTENFFAPFEARHFGKRGPVWMLQEANYDVLTGLNHGTFTLIHEDGRQATIPHAIRIYGVPEIRALLLDVGFREVRAFSAFGEEPAAVGKRPLIVATR